MRRSKIDIVIAFLEAAKSGVNITGLVYRTNTNFDVAARYLNLLQKQGFVENKEGKYTTTIKEYDYGTCLAGACSYP